MAKNSNFGPAGVCDRCGKFCCTLDQAGAPGVPGISCYHCHEGQFRHRAEWIFSTCPACNGLGAAMLCERCHWTGIVAVRKPEYLGSAG